MNLNDLLPYLIGAGGGWAIIRFGGRFLAGAAKNALAAAVTPPVAQVASTQESLSQSERQSLKKCLAEMSAILDKGEAK